MAPVEVVAAAAAAVGGDEVVGVPAPNGDAEAGLVSGALLSDILMV